MPLRDCIIALLPTVLRIKTWFWSFEMKKMKTAWCEQFAYPIKIFLERWEVCNFAESRIFRGFYPKFDTDQLIDLKSDNRTRTFDWLRFLINILVPGAFHLSINDPDLRPGSLTIGKLKVVLTVWNIFWEKCRWIMHYWSRIIDSIQEGDNNMVKDKVIQIPDLNYRHVIDFHWSESADETAEKWHFWTFIDVSGTWLLNSGVLLNCVNDLNKDKCTEIPINN